MLYYPITMSSPSNNTSPPMMSPKSFLALRFLWQNGSVWASLALQTPIFSPCLLLMKKLIDLLTNNPPLENETQHLSLPPTPKPKGKTREMEHDHQDPMSDNIYEEEKPLVCHDPNWPLIQEKAKMTSWSAWQVCQDPQCRSNLSGPSQRLAAIKEALQAICHEPHPSLSHPSLKPTTAEPHLTVKEHTCMKLSLPTMRDVIKKIKETKPENSGYSLNYPKFYNVMDGEEYPSNKPYTVHPLTKVSPYIKHTDKYLETLNPSSTKHMRSITNSSKLRWTLMISWQDNRIMPQGFKNSQNK